VHKSPDILNKYTQDDLNNLEKRKELIKILAKNPRYMNELPFDITITLNDLKELPPMMRFGFLEFLYSSIIPDIAYKYRRKVTTPDELLWQLQKSNAVRQEWRSKGISIEPISAEDVKSLLFSASFRQNDYVSQWFDNFKNVKGNKQLTNFLQNTLDLMKG
jgi:hypothetical protein